MKGINKENMKAGDFVYVIDKDRKRERAFIVKIVRLVNKIGNIDWWALEEKSKYLFELMVRKDDDRSDMDGNCNMNRRDWNTYNLFKLNKQEISKFSKHLILKNL